MAQSINKVILVGNLGHAPKVGTTSSGSKVVQFSIATSDKWKDRNTGEDKILTEWHRIVVFNPNLVEVCENMLQKGTRVYVEGALRTRKWQSQTGQDMYTTEVLLNGFSGKLIILANAKNMQEQPPMPDEPDGPFKTNNEAMDAAIDTMGAINADTDDIPF